MQKRFLLILIYLFTLPTYAYPSGRCDYPEHCPAPCLPPLFTSWCSSPSGWYARGDLGVSNMPIIRFQNQTTSNPVLDRTYVWGGASTDLAFGYRYHDLRFELSAGYLYDKFTKNYASTTGQNGNLYSGYVGGPLGMFNAYFDFNNPSIIFPYVGLGIGLLQTRYQWRINNADPANEYWVSSYSLAGQGIVGAGLRYNPHLSFTLDYRYLITPDNAQKIQNNATGSSYTSFNNSFQYINNLFSLGMIYEF